MITTDLLHAGREPSGFEDAVSWDAHLLAHGLEPKDGPLDPFRIASEGRVVGRSDRQRPSTAPSSSVMGRASSQSASRRGAGSI